MIYKICLALLFLDSGKFVYKTNLALAFPGSGKNDLQNLPRSFISRLGKNSFTKSTSLLHF